MTEFSTPDIPSNIIRRLEEALNDVEKGNQTALMTEAYNLFEGLRDEPRCPHYANNDEYDETAYKDNGEQFIIRQSAIIEQDDNGMVTALSYRRYINIDENGVESLDLDSQYLCLEEYDGEIATTVSLPNEMPDAEIPQVYYEKMYRMIREHADEIKRMD